MTSNSISVGWPKPKNVRFSKSNNKVNITWDEINTDTTPFTLDMSGNGVDNLKYKITESYKEIIIEYDIEGNESIVEQDSLNKIYYTNNTNISIVLSEAVNSKICFEIQAVYNFSDSELKKTETIISDKSNKLCIKLPSDRYCLKKRCKGNVGSVRLKETNSSKMRYSKAILGGINSVSTFNNSSNNYNRGFFNFNMLSNSNCKNSKYFATIKNCNNNN